MKVYLMCGLPGSGKSTWAKKKSREVGAIIINRDSLRTMFYGYYKFDPDYEYIVRNCAERLVNEIVECDVKDVIIDECSLSVLSRRTWINLINIYHMSSTDRVNIVLVWCKESYRNVDFRSSDLRGFTKEYWEDVINKMKNSFQPPDVTEGFDEIIEVVID